MVNYDKDRMELSSRDRVALANYTEIIEGRGTTNGGVLLDISHKEKDYILDKIPKIYRQFIEYQMLDISKHPMEVAPTAHYSMGGIKVEASNHQTSVKGLFAAGEVAGGLHGANRLGGNSLAEILVFGKQAGHAASIYSKNLTSHIRSLKVINNSHENINRYIKKGNQLAIPLQNELRDLMWKYCGVVKNEASLKIGLDQIRKLKKLLKDIDVRITDGNYKDLINTLELEASIYTAEATLKSSLERDESLGAYQRNDSKKSKNEKKFNCIICFKSHELVAYKKEINLIPQELKDLVDSSKIVDNFKNKLLE